VTWLRRWLLGDLAERVESLENWCRHHDAPRNPLRGIANWDSFSRDLRDALERRALDATRGKGN
jgi:hypothetical protein